MEKLSRGPLSRPVRRAVQGPASLYAGGSFLPFLYATPTLQPWLQKTLHTEALDTLPQEQQPATYRTVQRHPKHLVRRVLRSPQVEKPSAVREDYVPFDGLPRKTTKTLLDDSAFTDTTITVTERRAFEKLLKLSKAKKTADEDIEGPKKLSIRKREEAARLEKLATAKEVEEIIAQRSEGENGLLKSSPEKTALDLRVKEDLITVQKSLETAATDQDLWRSLLSQILGRVVALKLDTIETPLQRQALDEARGIRKAPRKTDRAVNDLDVLLVTMPRHLTAFMRMIRKKFPASPIALMVLPWYQRLGPTAFALGASTALYNAHMTALYELNHDLPSIVSTLEDMDRNVYSFDQGTQSLLDRIVAEGLEAQHSAEVSGRAILSRLQRNGVWLEQLTRWRGRVQSRRQEDALRKAQEQEALLHATDE